MTVKVTIFTAAIVSYDILTIACVLFDHICAYISFVLCVYKPSSITPVFTIPNVCANCTDMKHIDKMPPDIAFRSGVALLGATHP